MSDNCKSCGACRNPEICSCCGSCRNCGKAHGAPTVNPPAFIPVPFIPCAPPMKPTPLSPWPDYWMRPTWVGDPALLDRTVCNPGWDPNVCSLTVDGTIPIASVTTHNH